MKNEHKTAPVKITPPTLNSVEKRITENAYDQARSEISDLEKYLADWSEKHSDEYKSATFFANPSQSYMGRFRVPAMLYNADNSKGWQAFRETFIKERTETLAAKIAEKLLAQLDALNSTGA